MILFRCDGCGAQVTVQESTALPPKWAAIEASVQWCDERPDGTAHVTEASTNTFHACAICRAGSNIALAARVEVWLRESLGDRGVGA